MFVSVFCAFTQCLLRVLCLGKHKSQRLKVKKGVFLGSSLAPLAVLSPMKKKKLHQLEATSQRQAEMNSIVRNYRGFDQVWTTGKVSRRKELVSQRRLKTRKQKPYIEQDLLTSNFAVERYINFLPLCCFPFVAKSRNGLCDALSGVSSPQTNLAVCVGVGELRGMFKKTEFRIFKMQIFSWNMLKFRAAHCRDFF